jgi:purine-binding chemotaxis protein CheW
MSTNHAASNTGNPGQPHMDQATPGGDGLAEGQLLTFGIDREVFALPVEHIREVVDPPPITEVPHAPDFAPGVVNVRGNVVPVVDLRRRLGFGPPEQDIRMIVSEVKLQGEITPVGILADAVYGVVEALPTELEAIPRIGTRWRPDLVKGVVKQGERFVVLLDIDRLLSAS